VADLLRDLRRQVVGLVDGAGPDIRRGVDGLGLRVGARINGLARPFALIV
jgi:hypothetical protein